MRALALISGLTFLALSGAPRARAQTILDPANSGAARAIEAFETVWARADGARIRGSWTFTKPALGYNLRYWAAYDLLAPASQFDFAKPVSVGLILCVMPAGGKPVYLFQRHDIQRPKLEESAMKAAAKKLSLHFGGGFFAGAGKYTYRFLLADQEGRIFRKSGSFDVKHSPAPNAAAPGSIAPLGAPAWSGFPSGAEGGHATVLIHAAPVSPRRNVTRLQPYDRYVLVSALGTLLSQGGYSSAHVIVFDLAGRRVLFDEENFDRSAMRRLRRTLDEADFGTIAYQTLATGPSPHQVAESVLLRAAEQREDQETVVFLGPAWMPARRQRPIRPALKESLPKVHYLALVPRPLLPQDAISEIVRALKGRVHPIYQPSDFAAAIRKLASGG